MLTLFFVFFKQKTAYEMRISDWSSDVCSSDRRDCPCRRRGHASAQTAGRSCTRGRDAGHSVESRCRPDRRGPDGGRRALGSGPAHARAGAPRSEEHTSELQSLMRISYAVFCLKKKKKLEETAEHTDYNKRTRRTIQAIAIVTKTTISTTVSSSVTQSNR